MMSEITICDAPTDADREAIRGVLAVFNADSGYPADAKPIAILLKDEAGTVVGGLWAKTVYDWMFVEYLIVPESMRGRNLGATLMRGAEKIAADRGCVGAWLTTFSFQAQGFYEKLGYSVFGTLDNHPRDNVSIFLRKRLD